MFEAGKIPAGSTVRPVRGGDMGAIELFLSEPKPKPVDLNAAKAGPRKGKRGHVLDPKKINVQCDSCVARYSREPQHLMATGECPKCGEQQRIYDYKRTLGRIETNAGSVVVFGKILMYRADQISTLLHLQQAAEGYFQRQSLGLGYIGSLTSVLMFQAVTGLIEHGLTNSANKKGHETMAQYHSAVTAVRHSARFRDLAAVQNCEQPTPESWVSQDDRHQHWVMFPGEPFITVEQLNGTPISIRWESVAQYWAVTPEQAWLRR